jgi:hypothetical protein
MFVHTISQENLIYDDTNASLPNKALDTLTRKATQSAHASERGRLYAIDAEEVARVSA